MPSLPQTNGLSRITAALANFDIAFEQQITQSELQLNNLVNDSRAVSKGDVFCAVQGHDADGRKFIAQAIAQGAALVIAQCQHAVEHGKVTYQQSRDDNTVAGVAIINFYQLNQYLYTFASAYYQQPQQKMKVVGITGTNGKTTTSQIIASLLETNNHACAVIGTVGAGRLTALSPIANTTPGATELLSLLDRFANENISHVAMEVSSHALAQRRVDNSLFDISVFTNLSRDHLDYHQTMAEYAAAKFEIFSGDAHQIAVINGDDAQAKIWLAQSEPRLTLQPMIVYGLSKSVKSFTQFIRAENIVLTAQGVGFKACSHIGDIDIQSPLLGEFNIENLLAAMAVLLATKVPLIDIANAVSQIKPIAGRMEAFFAQDKATAVVDYAHTPDALSHALQACRKHCQGELWLVFGCGGDRDTGKRALMGTVAEQLADHLVITNDNPRNETPEAIAGDILSGCKNAEKITVLLDRPRAVLTALNNANAQDVVLLAGKGHEKNIIIGDKTLPYDERAVVRSFYQNEVVA